MKEKRESERGSIKISLLYGLLLVLVGFIALDVAEGNGIDWFGYRS